MKTLKLKEQHSELSDKNGGKPGARPLPGESAALPLCLIDTQTLRTLKVEVDSQQIAAVPEHRMRKVSVGTPALSLALCERAEGYDPYNNFGESAASRRPRVAAQGSRH